jgi:hypothetical protein
MVGTVSGEPQGKPCTKLVPFSILVQEPAPTGLALTWSAVSALVCCLPWLALSMKHHRTDCIEAIKDPTHTKIAIICGATLA